MVNRGYKEAAMGRNTVLRTIGLVALMAALVFSAGLAQASISVGTSPTSVNADGVDAHVGINISTSTSDGTVIVEIIHDFNSNGSVDGGEWASMSVTAVDNQAVIIDPGDPQFQGDLDPTVGSLTVVMVDMYDYLAPGQFIVRATNSANESATAVVTVNPTTSSIYVTGTVRDGITNSPISDVMLFAFVNATQMASTAYTDGSGNYSLLIPASGPAEIYVVRAGYLESGGEINIPGGGLTGNNYYMGSTNSTITGTVTEYGTGNPVFGIPVEAQNINGYYTYPKSLSDATGQYVVNVVNGTDWSLDIRKRPGYFHTISDATYNYADNPVITPPGVANLIAFPETAWINGTVYDEYGTEVVEGALFYAGLFNNPAPMFQDLGNADYTDLNGQVNIGLMAGQWNVGLCVSCHERPVFVNGVEKDMVPPPMQTIALTNGQTANVTFNAYYADGIVDGYVYADDGVTPASNATVSAWTDNALNGVGQTSVGQISAETDTDATGYFRLPLLGGTWTIKAEMNKWNKESGTQQVVINSNGDEVVGNYGTESVTGLSFLLNLSIGGSGASPSSLDFGDVVVGDTSRAKLVTFTNNSGGTIWITNATVSGVDAGLFYSQSALTNPCPDIPFMAPDGASCNMIVNFYADSTGPKSASLDVTTTDPQNPNISVALSGTGVNPYSGSISGTVTYTGAQVGMPIAAAFTSPISCSGPNQDPPYYVQMTGGPTSYSYTLSGLPDGVYYIGAVIFTSGEDVLDTDPYGAYGGCDTSTAVNITGGGSQTSIDFSMQDGPGNPMYYEYSAWGSSWHTKDGYSISVGIDDPTQTLTGVTADGAGIVNGPVALVYNGTYQSWEFANGTNPGFTSVSSGQPLVYNLTLDDPIQGTIFRTASVDDFLEDYAHYLTPSGGAVINTPAPQFSWGSTGVTGMSFTVKVEGMNDSVYWEAQDVSSPLVYNGPALTDGNMYQWRVIMQNPNRSGGGSEAEDLFIYSTSGQPNIYTTPTSYDFGNINVGGISNTTNITVGNNGSVALVLGTAFINGANASEFQITGGCSGQTVAPSNACGIYVQMTPQSFGTKLANLVIPSNDPDTPEMVVPLSGYGTNSNYDLNVYIQGTGFGNVTSIDAGIQCGDGTSNDCYESYSEGSYVELWAAPSAGSTFTGWSGAGSGCVSGSTTPCSFDITSNTSITATFDASGTHTITASVYNGVGGNISPSGGVQVSDGFDQAFYMTPDPGYYVSDVVVDSVSYGKITSYTFFSVTSNHTIEVHFSPMQTIQAMASVGDINSNGADDIAVLVTTYTNGHYASVRDGSTGVELLKVYFGDTIEPLKFLSIPDQNGNGFMELVYFGKEIATGALIAQVKDASTGTYIRGVWFDKNYTPIDFKALPDISGNGKEELVLLGTHNTMNWLVTQIVDSYTGTYVKGIWFDKNYIAFNVVVVPDISGNSLPELAVLGTHSINGQAVVQIKDASTTTHIRSTWFDKNYLFDAFEVAPDSNGDTSPELVLLGTHNSTGSLMAQVKEASSATHVASIFYDKNYVPLKMLVLDDISANGASEAIPFGSNVSGLNLAQIRDEKTGAFVRNVFYDTNLEPMDATVTGDISGDLVSDVAMLGKNKSTGDWSVLVKDPVTGNYVSLISFPNH